MSEPVRTRSDGTRIAVAVLGAVIVLGGAFGLTRHRGAQESAGAQASGDGDVPSLWATGAAAASVAHTSNPSAYDDPNHPEPTQSPTMRACREIRAAGLVHACERDAARGEAGEITRFVDDKGSENGYVVRMNEGTSIDKIVAATIADKHAARPCEVVGSPGSRMIAILGTGMSCEQAPQVRAALDRQSTVTMLACLELVREGLVPQCESAGSFEPSGGGQFTNFLNEQGEYHGGGITHLERSVNIAEKVTAMRDEESHKSRPCEIVASPASGMIAILSPAMGCEQAPRVRAALDQFEPHDR